MSANRGDAIGDQVAGQVKEAVGNVGNALGLNNDMDKEGQQQREKGDAQYKAAQGEQAAEGAKDDVKSAFQKNVGGLFSDDQKRKGEANEASAEAKKEASKH